MLRQTLEGGGIKSEETQDREVRYSSVILEAGARAMIPPVALPAITSNISVMDFAVCSSSLRMVVAWKRPRVPPPSMVSTLMGLLIGRIFQQLRHCAFYQRKLPQPHLYYKVIQEGPLWVKVFPDEHPVGCPGKLRPDKIMVLVQA